MANQKAVAKSASKPGKALAETKKTSTAIAVADMMEDAGAGLENTDKDSFAVPFLMVIQKTSPQVDRTQPEYIKGIEAGDIMLSSTLEFWKEDGVQIVICGFERKFLKWAPQDEGGGFKGQMTPAQFNAALAAGDVVEADGKMVDAEGNVIRDTRVHYIMVVRDDGTFTPAVLSMASTQVKKSKLLLTQIQSYRQETADGRKFQPASFAHVFRATTVPESNDKGNWAGWKIVREDYVDNAELYRKAKEFHQLSINSEIRLDDKAKDGEGADERV
jgi:hypothetical protein